MRRVDVVGAVIKEDNNVLCALRSAQMSQGGFWEFPGGKVEQNEDPKEALQREIKEELGCLIEVGNLIEDTLHPYPELEVHLMTYEARILEGNPEAHEHEEIRWVDRSHLSELKWAPADIPTVQTLVKNQIEF